MSCFFLDVAVVVNRFLMLFFVGVLKTGVAVGVLKTDLYPTLNYGIDLTLL